MWLCIDMMPGAIYASMHISMHHNSRRMGCWCTMLAWHARKISLRYAVQVHTVAGPAPQSASPNTRNHHIEQLLYRLIISQHGGLLFDDALSQLAPLPVSFRQLRFDG